MISAHTSEIQTITVSFSGHLVATTSRTGTLVRVFESKTGALVAELRRGLDRAEVFCVAFDPEGTRICVASDKGTVHVFNLGTKRDVVGAVEVAQAGGVGLRGVSNAAYNGSMEDDGFVMEGEEGGVQDEDIAAISPRVESGGGRRFFSTPLSNVTSFLPSFTSHKQTASTSSTTSTTISMSAYLTQMSQSFLSNSVSSSSTSSSNQPAHFQPHGPSPPGTASSVAAIAATEVKTTNRQSSLSFFSPLSKYFSSQWSFAQFTLPTESRCICAFTHAEPPTQPPAFSSNKTDRWSPPAPGTGATGIVVLCADGTYHRFVFNAKKGGDGVRNGFYRFYKGKEEEANSRADGGDGW